MTPVFPEFSLLESVVLSSALTVAATWGTEGLLQLYRWFKGATRA